LGAQDCFYEPYGAYTGAVSTNLLVDIGVKHVLIGHSERRTIFKEDDAMINEKVLKVCLA
jgi:triosephosphate isomerase